MMSAGVADAPLVPIGEPSTVVTPGAALRDSGDAGAAVTQTAHADVNMTAVPDAAVAAPTGELRRRVPAVSATRPRVGWAPHSRPAPQPQPRRVW